MPKAVWNGTVIAEGNDTVVVEGNHYFSPESVRMDLLKPSSHVTTCPWKGAANYYSIAVDGAVNENAAWVYRDPKDAAKQITGRIAFWKGVKVA